jgi:hypothetical protein
VNTFGSKFGFQMVGDTNDKPSCGLDCTIGGCGRCIEEAGNRTISGKLHVSDLGNCQSDEGCNDVGPIEGARVTLQYNGLNVTQVFTDEEGKFEFPGLNSRSECANYRLVFEKFDYQDVCKGTENSVLCSCGYITNTTGNFSALQFVNNSTFFIDWDSTKCRADCGYINAQDTMPGYCTVVKTSTLP